MRSPRMRIKVVDRLILAIVLGLGLGLGLSTSSPAYTASDQELFERSRRTALRGDWVSAVEGFNDLLARHPDGPLADDAYFWLGFSYAEVGRYNEAARAYRELLSRFPDSPLRPDASLRLARLLEGPLNDDKAAEQVYRDIAPAERTEPLVRFKAQMGMARIKEKRKDYPAAVEEYRKGESDAMAAPGVPTVQVEVQRKVKSRRAFLDENAARSPEGLPLYTDAERLAGSGRPSEAETVLRELMDRHPDFPAMDRALVLLSRVLEQQGRRAAAEAVLEEASRRFPRSEAVADYRRERRTLKALDELKVRPVR